MRGRTVLLVAAAALVVGLLVMLKHSLSDVEAPPPVERPPADRVVTSAHPTETPAEPVAITTQPVRPAAEPAPRAPATSVPSQPSLPAIVAEYVPQKKLPPIASKQMLREQTAAVEPQLAACAAGTKLSGTATLTFVLAHKGNDAVVETTGIDYDATTITDEPMLECMRETARAMTFKPVPDSSAIYVTRKIDLEAGKLTGNKFLDFSRVR